MRVRPPAPTRLARAVLVGASVWSGAGVCGAASCPVEFRGALSEAWLRAGRDIAMLTTEPGDCARIELEVDPSADAARLTFVTRDGRRAERRLAHPDELMPTVVALGIGGPTQASAPALEDPSRTPARKADAVPPPDSPPSGTTAPPREARALFALLGGARGGTGRLVSPVIGGAAAIALDRWELGLNLALELQYFDLRLSDPDGPSSAASVGVTVGRREPIANVELLFGARSMVAAVNDESVKDSGERGRAELRLGPYLGGVWPRTRGMRFRADLALDVVPHASLGAVGTRVTPWLAASALLGVEVRGP